MLTGRHEYLGTVPANGFFLLRVHSGEIVSREPVVAFTLFKYRAQAQEFIVYVFPMTFDEVFADDSQEYVIERPDGKFEVPADCTIATRAELEKYLMEQHQKLKAARDALKV